MMKDQSYKHTSNTFTYLENFRRKSTLLPKHNYSDPAVHHVTLCAQGIEGRGPLFAHPVLYKLLQTNWLDLPRYFTSIQLDEFVIMPDHIHFLIWLNKWPERVYKRHPYLWEVIRVYKSKVAVEWIDYIKKNHPQFSGKIWQKKYDKYLLRVGELPRIRLYIRENPEKLYMLMNWESPF